MRTTPENMRKLAKGYNQKKHRESVIYHYKTFLKTIRKYARKGHCYIESRYMQLEPNFDGYIALRFLSMKTDFKVTIYCDDEEYANNGILNYGKWADDRDWETKFKYVIKW